MKWLVLGLLWTFAACDQESVCERADLAPLPRTPRFAVVTSDRSSTAIALLDQDATLITEAWIDSGTTSPILTATLDGDVVMPTDNVGNGVLNLLNQLGATVITRIEIPTGDVLAQFSAQRPEPASDDMSLTRFRANIQDMLDLGDGHVLVSRFEPNRREGAEPLDLGNDLVFVRLADGVLTNRIALDTVNLTVDDVLYYARPTTMVSVGPRVIVATTRLDTLYASGPGAFAVVDPSSRVATPVEADGLRDCLEAVSVPGDPSHAIVLCAGDTFTNMDGRRTHAGLLYVSVDAAGTASIDAVWRAAEHLDQPVPSNGLVALGGTRVAVNAMGDRSTNTSDNYLLLDVASGEMSTLFISEGSFVVSKGAFEESTGRLLVPDANAGVRVLEASGNTFVDTEVVNTSPCRRLPAREVRLLSAAE